MTPADAGFRTVYFGFGFEGVTSADQRNALMGRAIDYLLAEMSPIPAAGRGSTTSHASTRGRLATVAAHERRSVCELLDVRVTVHRWEDCPRRQGRRRVSGNGKANGCPVCHSTGQVPDLRISGLWTELRDKVKRRQRGS